MKPWIYLVLCLQQMNIVVKGFCPSDQLCELHEWVSWDCTNCCTENAAPEAAIRKRRICCAEQDNLVMCLNHCNISTDQVEENGLCKDHCKCPGTPPVLTTTIQAAGVTVKYTRSNLPVQHTTTAFRTLSTNNPAKHSDPSNGNTQNSNSSTLRANQSNQSTNSETMDSGTTEITDSPVFISLLVLGLLAAITAGIITAYWFLKKKKRQIDAKQNDLTVPDLTKN